jgi:tetratricopeptide (TPR) repeat protein
MSAPTRPIHPTPPPAIEDVLKLLDHLYLQPRPDILTLPIYEKRYQAATQHRAVAYILEQSRHLINASRDYKQIGLCCFHAGLIYRRWGHHLNAAHFFNDARLYWSLANEQPYICLAWFAQAAAQHEGLQLETALINYEKAQRHLPRLEQLIRLQTTGQHRLQISAFSVKISRLLADVYQQLRRELWQMNIAFATPPPVTTIINADGDSDRAETAAPPSEAAPATTSEIERPRIHSDLRMDAVGASETGNGKDRHGRYPLTGRPTAAYTRRWFKLTNSGDKLLPELEAGDMVLVSLAGMQAYQNDELLVTTGYILDAVYVCPQESNTQEDTCCLGLYKGANESGAWILFRNDQLPTAVSGQSVVGHVIARWRNFSD